MRIKPWLQVFRAHTAPVTILTLFVYFTIAGGSLISIEFLLMLVAAIAMHYLGFGHNSLMDYTAGYDKIDPYKTHFPLVKGEIKLKKAHNVIHSLMMLSALYIVYITLSFGKSPDKALAFFALALAFGHAYNDGLGKTSVLKFIPLSLYAVCAGCWAYFFVANTANTLFYLVTAYMLIVYIYQIGYEGELKDINSFAEDNLLRKIGVKVFGIKVADKYFINSTAGLVLSFTLTALKIIFLMCIGIPYLVDEANPVEIIAVALTIIMMFFIVKFSMLLTFDREYNHDEDLRNMAVVEVFSAFAIVSVLIPYAGLIESLLIMLFSIAYFILFNRYLWGTTIKPKV